MGWLVSFAVGAAAGLATSAVFHYLFAPASETARDENYRSRLDWALAEGEKAAAEKERALRLELEAAKQPKPVTPPVE
jgi:hypothetical protein